MGSPRSYIGQLQRNGHLPDVDYVLNHVVNRIPTVGPRLRAYRALGVHFDTVQEANIALGVEVWNGPGLSLGRLATVGQRCYLDARGGVRIDEHANLSREVTILTATHVVNDPDFEARIAGVYIGTRVFVGVRAMILPGVSVGEGAVVGAGAIVTRDVAPYTVVAGSPATPIGKRQEPMRYEVDWRPSWY